MSQQQSMSRTEMRIWAGVIAGLLLLIAIGQKIEIGQGINSLTGIHIF